MRFTVDTPSRSFLALMILWAGAGSLTAGAEEAANKSLSTAKAAVTSGSLKAYIGVHIGELHPAFASQLHGLIPEGQGITVESVSPNSPAADAGLREHDILLTYGDQKLFNCEQLVKLIANDQPGREVHLRLVRQGKEEQIKVRLGERPANWVPPHYPLDKRFQVPPQPRHGPAATTPIDGYRPTWHQLESITIKWLEKDRFRATLTHFDNAGKIEKHEYEGTREELRKLIDADDDLRSNERRHLFRSLDIEERPHPWKLFGDDNGGGF